MQRWWPGWRGFATSLALLALLGGLAMLAGAYDMAASKGHWGVVRAALQLGKERSVATWSLGAPAPPDLADPELIRLGREHARVGCTPCHGLPEVDSGAIAGGLLPTAPPLPDAADRWEPKELYRIVRHGLKMTGMPAWPTPERGDEVWALVAFIEAWGRSEPEALTGLYRDHATSALETTVGGARDPVEELVAERCAPCHGAPGEEPVSTLVPPLSGQPPEYLARSLREYRGGLRRSGFMSALAVLLSDSEIDALAAYYATGAPPDAPTLRPPDGAVLARRGLPSEGLPPCDACHGADADPRFPRLDGLPARYLAGQLEHWEAAGRSRTAWGAVMTPIVERLDPEQMQAAAAYYGGGVATARANP